MAMNPDKKAKLEAAGWKVGSADEFLGLALEESATLDIRLPANIGAPSITHLAGKYAGEEWDELLEEIKRNRQAGLEQDIIE